MTAAARAGVIRKRRKGLQVQAFAGHDPLTGRKRWLSRQVDGQTKAAWREAKKVEAQLLEQVDRGEPTDEASAAPGNQHDHHHQRDQPADPHHDPDPLWPYHRTAPWLGCAGLDVATPARRCQGGTGLARARTGQSAGLIEGHG
jgi:hypothetical protein